MGRPICDSQGVKVTVSVVLADSARSFDKEYTYAVPEGMQVLPGMRVLVPFGRKKGLRGGWITRLNPPKTTYALKDIAEAVDEAPLITEDLLKVAEWMRGRYLCTWHQALSVMLPSGARLVVQENGTYQKRANEKTCRAMEAAVSAEDFDALCREGAFRSLHHVHILETLLQEGLCTVSDLCLLQGVTPGMLLTLKKKGLVRELRLDVDRDPFQGRSVEPVLPPNPTEEQENAFQTLAPLLDQNGGEALIFGVTGSGKTELYLRLIEESLKKGKGAVMLVPEISLTPQTVDRFLGRFGSRVAVLHSRLSIGERYDQWRGIKNGNLDVVVGARSAIFAPLKNLGIVIIDEEHEGAYKAESTPGYDARLVARARCNISGGLLLYGSATPSLETFHRAESGTLLRVDLKQRVAGRPLPKVTLIDMKKEMQDGNRTNISNALKSRIAAVHTAKEQSILLLNRRGLSSFMLCRDCGMVLSCPHCSISLTLHQKDRCVCHYCGYLEKVPKCCPSCGSEQFIPMGMGTQKLEADLLESTQGLRVVRMDLDSTSGKDGHKKQLDLFRNGEADLLVGTQMVAKGHDFPNVTLVGILSADAMLSSGDFRSSEKTFQLLAQAAGRAGRDEKPGEVLVQAYNLDHYCLQAVIHHDYEGFYHQEIALRQQLNLPPFYHVGVVLVSSKEITDAENLIQKVYRYLRDAANFTETAPFMLSEPLPAPISQMNGRFRFRIILRHRSVRTLLSVLNILQETFSKETSGKEVHMGVDIDPGSML